MEARHTSVCRKCQKQYEEKLDLCPVCETPVEHIVWYERPNLERYAFITTVLVVSIIAALFDNDNENALGGYLLGAIVGLFFLYRGGALFLDIGTVTGKVRAREKFSWQKYLREFLVPLKVLGAMIVAAIGLALMGLVGKLLWALVTWPFR